MPKSKPVSKKPTGGIQSKGSVTGQSASSTKLKKAPSINFIKSSREPESSVRASAQPVTLRQEVGKVLQ